MNTEEISAVSPVITLTASAAEEIKTKLSNEPENAGKYLRVYIEPGGCSGMQYGMVFDEKRPDDTLLQYFGVGVIIDNVSADQLRGAVIDFVEAMTGGGFKISNPNARQSCGCGKSFQT